jgi:hypothetical protein
MDQPPDLEEEFYAAEMGVVEARSALCQAEYELTRLGKEHPEIRRRPDSDPPDLRADLDQDALKRINAALKLTGKEVDYWLRLAAYAREKLGISDDDFQGMTRETLVGLIQEGLEGPGGPVSERIPLLEEYACSGAMLPGRCSDRRLYRSENFPAGEKEFKNWKSGKLPRTSQTAFNIEQFLREKRIPKE